MKAIFQREWCGICEAKNPDVAAAIVRADGEYALAESCLEIANTPQDGEGCSRQEWQCCYGQVRRLAGISQAVHRDVVQSAGDIQPQRRGERVAEEVSGPDGGPVASVRVVERRIYSMAQHLWRDDWSGCQATERAEKRHCPTQDLAGRAGP